MDKLLKYRYLNLKIIDGFPIGTIKTKRVWVSLLNIKTNDDFNNVIKNNILIKHKRHE